MPTTPLAPPKKGQTKKRIDNYITAYYCPYSIDTRVD